MNEELTNEALEAMERCGEDIGDQCTDCPAKRICHAFDALVRIKFLATALLEERAKPKVWVGAPENVNRARVYFGEIGGVYDIVPVSYTRELPKTRARQIAEEIVRGINDEIYSDTKDIEYVEGVLKRYAEELTKKETN